MGFTYVFLLVRAGLLEFLEFLEIVQEIQGIFLVFVLFCENAVRSRRGFVHEFDCFSEN